jgi:hypothetical protein
MFTTTCKRVGLVALMFGMALGLSACATGYITTSVQSVVGLDVSENPKTQVPHIRFGFVRSQYYYLPTGKSESAQGAPSSGRADETPTLVSSIDVDMQFLQSGKISEKFAVGPAVHGDAAKMLFNPKYQPIPAPSAKTSQLIQQIGKLTKDKSELKAKVKKDWIDKNYPDFKGRDFDDFVLEAPDDEARQLLLQYLEANPS